MTPLEDAAESEADTKRWLFLPAGGATQNPNEYVAAWRAFVAPVAAAFGGATFDTLFCISVLEQVAGVFATNETAFGAAFPQFAWTYSVGMSVAASGIHADELGDRPMFVQVDVAVPGWFAGYDDDKEPSGPTCSTPVEAFSQFSAGRRAIRPVEARKRPKAGSPAPSRQIRPAYYGGKDNPYEAIKVIRAWGLNFELGTAAKYLARAGKKPGAHAIEDLRKLVTYVEMEIERRGTLGDSPVNT